MERVFFLCMWPDPVFWLWRNLDELDGAAKT